MIDTDKEAREYYEHNPQDKDPLHIILVQDHAKKEIEDYYVELCVLKTMNSEDYTEGFDSVEDLYDPPDGADHHEDNKYKLNSPEFKKWLGGE